MARSRYSMNEYSNPLIRTEIVCCYSEFFLQIDLAISTEVHKAQRILEELEKAAKEGKGAAQLDGRLIDAASARMAENIVRIDKQIKSK